jgi:hypothetical protein
LLGFPAVACGELHSDFWRFAKCPGKPAPST